MNPVTVEQLNSAEKYRRSKQVEVCQLLNRAQAGQSSRTRLHERVTYRLGTLLGRRGSTAESRRASTDGQVLGQATE